ncbi:DinB family protein [Planomicrobium sp. YIM 101495]|uniref:DinB family protein n=1 Tax=Planomicrobium sp. YIM 101495 TaxID=2665160 RepID=UPI0012B805A3|nr:DinB family protein [Planomicrobium sp. YIM 101495]MTD29884.1 DUF1569 domain-containing protein [Planomicrobium sp. YIM 101495]
MFKDENAKIRYDVLKAVEGLDDERLNTKPDDGSWSAMQVLDHMQKMEWVIATNVEKELEKEKNIKAVKKPIQVTISRAVKVEAPKFVVPTGEFVSLEEMKEKLNLSHNKLYEVYDTAPKHLLEEKSLPHPVFSRLPLSQWFPFVGLHEKRHLAQLRETLNKIDAKTIKS